MASYGISRPAQVWIPLGKKPWHQLRCRATSPCFMKLVWSNHSDCRPEFLCIPRHLAPIPRAITQFGLIDPRHIYIIPWQRSIPPLAPWARPSLPLELLPPPPRALHADMKLIDSHAAIENRWGVEWKQAGIHQPISSTHYQGVTLNMNKLDLLIAFTAAMLWISYRCRRYWESGCERGGNS